ncbi:MAG TPA: diguanylate cyclase, partial [Miltoncostaea sp.]|nr:diguanylate cyclase [Miltoncostaea sp.]
LVAEDSGFAASVIRDALTTDGHGVEVVGDGDEALARLREGAPVDLLVTGGDMPGRSGVSLCRAARRDPRLAGLPIIFLTSSDGMTVDALDAGADDHLSTPFRPDELRARVRAALRVARHRAEAEAERDLSRALVESLQDGLLVLTADARIVRVNGRFSTLTGFGREDLVGAGPPFPFWPAVRASRYGTLLRAALRTGLAGEADRTYVRADGAHRFVIVSLARLPGTSADGAAFVSTVKDVTTRRAAEEELRRSEAVARGLAREQAALGRVAAAVAEAQPPEAVFALVAREVAGLFGVEAGGVARFVTGDRAMLVGSWASMDAMRLPTGSVFTTTDESLSGRVRRERRPVREVSQATGGRHGAGHVARRSAVAAPVWVEGELWGTVGALSSRSDGLPEDAAPRIGKFAALVGLAIASASAREELTRLAQTDALTGLANRRAFEARLHEEVGRARRDGSPLSVVVLDMDHFKEVNDRHGHEEGDRTLATLAARMRSTTRASDMIARIGGEEFAWLLPATDSDGAEVLAERLRGVIAAEPFGAAGTRTISGGVAALGPDDDALALLRRADARLYAAKAAGRDRVVAA